ncbi:hydrogenase nickel incorporation protein HypB [Magnetovibrio sp.]|uniref:hydrogenase nickel incorporation protein HypB n=1 Tax=Magnetovibrio sp. TaxID=2024836 RepID=UPI002F92A291
MCTVCGCGKDDVKVEGERNAHSPNHTHDHNDHHHPHHDHDHLHDHGHDHQHHDHDQHHDHSHDHSHEHVDAAGDLHYGKGIGGAHVPGISQARIVQIEQDILGKNDHLASHNRARFVDMGVLALNLVSSPGSGKTTLLARSAADLLKTMPVAVVEGDQQTALDADRIRDAGVPAVQVNTGKGCHLDAHMVGRAVDSLSGQGAGLESGGVLFIENVGNLVCPAAFDLGEAAKVVILSVTEGEDKPLKYPDMFHASDLMILNKSDLLPYVPFSVEKCIEYARRINPDIEVVQLSALTGEGLQDWYDWIENRRAAVSAAKKTA